MADNDTFAEVAKADLMLRIVLSFVFGIISVIAGIILLIVLAVNKQSDLALLMIVLIIVGLLVSGICGYFMFKKGGKKKE